jgi:Tfp pilus assembly protein PilF
MCNSSKVRGGLVSLLLIGALGGGCDDLSSRETKSKTKPTPPLAPVTMPAPPETLPPPKPAEVTKVVEADPTKTAKKTLEIQPLPNDPLEAARQLLGTGDFEQALAMAKKAADKYPQRSGAWNVLGRAELQVGHKKRALDAFEKAVELNPSNSYAHNNFGLALIYDGRPEEAVDELEQAVELEPVEGYMWNNLGMAYEQLDRLDDARGAYNKAAEMQSDRAKESLARLKGVQSVVRTAKVDTKPLDKERGGVPSSE